MEFSHKKIEKKWQKFWEEKKIFKTKNDSQKKQYILDMFPYPSGSGLHVGHPKGYTASDVLSRFRRMQGYDVLHPIGWDAFGLPAEQYALKTNNDPTEFTNKNIDVFKKQIKSLGFSYDWDKELSTAHPNFYKITQWIFQQIYKKGLASIEMVNVNWCPNLGTVLSNEEVEVNSDGLMVSRDFGGHPVEKKPLRQWVLKITNYADKLLSGIESLDWKNSLKDLQKNWIGKSNGMVIKFKVDKLEAFIDVYTTRPDTIFGATYLVLAPEHIAVNMVTVKEKRNEVDKYVEISKKKTDIDRQDDSKEKTGVWTGAYAINPLNNEKIKIFVADYVLADYALGAIMAVPAHDPRDWEFATKYGLEKKFVLDTKNKSKPFVGDSRYINSNFLNNLNKEGAIKKISEHLVNNKIGYAKINYKIRDWVFSRQRYYGEPFPLYFSEDGKDVFLLDENELPLLLPKLKNIKPSGNGESPLANSSKWVNFEKNGKKYKRDTNTMPQWAGSCWYYLAYILAESPNNFVDIKSKKAKELFKKWLPVDVYIGGQEHAVGHLIYSRFWHKVLYDIGIVPNEEPYIKLINQGMIQDEKGQKMSKSKGNVINPDDIIQSHGADSLRLYIMFMVPIESSAQWNYKTLDSSRNWLDRVYRMFRTIGVTEDNDGIYDFAYNQTVKNVTNMLESCHFNTPISQLMQFVNEIYKIKKPLFKQYALNFIKMLSIYAPHLGEELWEMYSNNNESVYIQEWPAYDEKKLIVNTTTVAIQINGKLRATIETDKGINDKLLTELSTNLLKQKNYLHYDKIKKVIIIKDKIINFVV
ncbi:leucine--tRNA ligase [Spiroplasma endosymbiont of Aspidapion aeneum]|uniref:leucine--tRNA ligase n=1 Tax=Spiroplasma endosymbiont of Aspidapion aeneum TaxID=3066276 RepID=UPI00313E24C0